MHVLNPKIPMWGILKLVKELLSLTLALIINQARSIGLPLLYYILHGIVIHISTLEKLHTDFKGILIFFVHHAFVLKITFYIA